MVNHVRTLLLNESGSVTPGSSSGFFVDNDYEKLMLPPMLRSVHDAYFQGTPDISKKIKMVDCAYEYTLRPDLGKYLSIFDSREMPFSGPDERFDCSAFTSQSARGILYNKTGIPSFDSRLLSLSSVFDSRVDGILRIACGVIAYAYQLEVIRIKHGNR